MNKNEALRLALEALKANDLLVKGTETIGGLEWAMDGYYSDCFDIEPVTKQTKEAITAVKAALEAKDEPVAWVNIDDLYDLEAGEDGDVPYVVRGNEQPKNMPKSIPLYTTIPQRKPLSDEPVAWFCKERNLVEIDCPAEDDFRSTLGWEPLYTTPPPVAEPHKRTWVGLTETECGFLFKVGMTPFDYYQAIEAKLKEKNQ
jgi:hypothetical protein